MKIFRDLVSLVGVHMGEILERVTVSKLICLRIQKNNEELLQ